ncbi:MAG: hypothetical protein A4E64_00281 [Syntrophorhabdus sp. PtaU1.Bin058]|nr:MAG: hypothetical protein A4E64_00281 [Syntrophorhabdus sp. PtaU1.Bin058]
MRSRIRRLLLVALFLALISSPVLCIEIKTDATKKTRQTVKPRTDSAPAKSVPDTSATEKVSVPDAVKYGTLSLMKPKSGDRFVQGNDMMIEWSKKGNIPSRCFRIGLIKDGAEVLQITSSVCVNGYKWKVPMDIWGSDFKVKVETTDKKVAAESAPFTIVNAKADLTVGQLTVTPQTLDAGQEAVIRARIDNAGQGKSEPMKAFIVMGFCGLTTYGGAKKIEYAVPSLNFGDHTYITHTEKFPVGGDVCVSVIVGTFWTPGSGDHMLPDQKTVHVSVRGGNPPDLVACIYNPRKVSVGSPAGIMAFVENAGERITPPSKMSIWVEGQGYAEFDVPLLKKGEHRYFSRSVTFQDEGETAFRADVDLNNNVTETNENNNRIVGKIIHRAVQDPAVKTELICSDGKKRQF